MTKSRYLPILFTLLLLAPLGLKAQTSKQRTSINQIVAVVNDHPILESDVDQRVRQIMYRRKSRGMPVSFSKKMWYRILNNLVEQFVLLEHAKIDSITVSDSRVNARIENRIKRIVKQVGSRKALEEQLGKSLLQVKTNLREQYRHDMIIRQYRRQKLSTIEITRPEVVEFYNQIPSDSLPRVPEKVAVSQIVIVPQAQKKAQKKAYQLAKALRDSILHDGKSFEALAKKYSEGPAAEKGGELPLVSVNNLVAPYAAAASALQPGDISKVVKSDFGYHIIRLDKRRGDKIATHNILIKVDEHNYNKQGAIKKLKAIRDTIISNPDVTFAEIARKKSEDPNTSDQGGQILQAKTGNRMLVLSELNPALYRIVLVLDEGEISEPKPFNVGTANNSKPAFRLIRLDKQIPAHTASIKTDYRLIKRAAKQRKKRQVVEQWMAKLKRDIYIEYKIPVPSYLKETVTPAMGRGIQQ